MTIEERKRTCSYCSITFKNKEAFFKHWNRCPVRIESEHVAAEELHSRLGRVARTLEDQIGYMALVDPSKVSLTKDDLFSLGQEAFALSRKFIADQDLAVLKELLALAEKCYRILKEFVDDEAEADMKWFTDNNVDHSWSMASYFVQDRRGLDIHPNLVAALYYLGQASQGLYFDEPIFERTDGC